jgi:hypothetical protein
MKKQYGIYGEFFYEIVDDKTKKIIVTSKKKRNLILNQGLDFLNIRSFVENVSSCAVSASTVGPLFTDTGLTNEFDRVSTLDTSLQVSASTTLIGNTYSFTRVFKFDSSVNPALYGTIGWSYTNTVGNNLFSKSLILTPSGGAGPVFVAQGQYLRVHYTINVILNPSSATSGNSNITGLPGGDGGSYGIQYIGLKSINSQNVVGFWDAGNDCNELYSQVEIFLSTSTAALSSFGSSTNRSASTNYLSKSANTSAGSGTGIITKQASFGKNNAVNGAIRSMGTGIIGSSTTNSGFAYVFTNNQSKAAAFTMSPSFIYSVVRM